MNVLLIIGLVLFVGTALWMYYLFITNTVSEVKEVKKPVEQPKETPTGNDAEISACVAQMYVLKSSFVAQLEGL